MKMIEPVNIVREADIIWKNRIARFYSKYGMFLILVVMIILSTAISDIFLTRTNISNVLRNMAVSSLAAFGVTFLLILGMIDLSSGSVMALAGCICCIVIRDTGSLVLGFSSGILIGGLTGIFNGAIVAYLRIPAFIITLATMEMARGAALLVTDGYPVAGMGNTFKIFGQGYVDSWNIVPTPIVVMFIFLAVSFVILNRTKLGRYVFAVGGNENAARASGVNIKRTIISAFVINGLMVGLAGIMLMSRINSGQPSGAVGYEFDAITAAVVGGTSLMGGSGTMIGTFIGGLIVGVLNNMLNLQQVSSFWQMVVKGAIIALAVIVDFKTKAILQKQSS
jgi:inositol transport system permease protein